MTEFSRLSVKRIDLAYYTHVGLSGNTGCSETLQEHSASSSHGLRPEVGTSKDKQGRGGLILAKVI
jgi:hypothetical protein